MEIDKYGSLFVALFTLVHSRVAGGLHWLKCWTVDRKVQGSSPTCSRVLFLFWVHSALSQILSRRFSFTSFEEDISCQSQGIT